MQTTSQTWKDLWASGTARLETVAEIAGVEYTDMPTAPVINRALMQSGLSIGNAVSATCQLSVRTANAIPKSAEVVVKQRLKDGQTTSEWLPAGTFYISRRQRDPVTGVMTLLCYDALLKANADMPGLVPWTTKSGIPITTQAGEMLYFNAVYPRSMQTVAREIAAMMGVEIDPRTSLATGSAYVVEKPEAGTPMHDVLAKIAAANGGNWIITPAGKLHLVKVADAADAAEATANVADVAGIISGFDTATTGVVTGIRCVQDDETHLTGDETGLVIDADVTVPVALDLADWMLGLTYQSFDLRGAVYDPAAEVGDYIRAGANGEVSAVLNVEAATLGPAFRGDLSSPQAGEMSDEYPYIGGSKKALQIAKAYAREVTEALDESLDQQSVFNRLTNNGSVQGLYMIDGQLYINMTYARSGTLVLGGLSNQNGLLEVRDANDNVIGTWNNNGVNVTKGTIAGPQISVGGVGNKDGLFTVYDASGNVIGTWNNNGVGIYKGTININKESGTSNDFNLQLGSEAPFPIYLRTGEDGTNYKIAYFSSSGLGIRNNNFDRYCFLDTYSLTFATELDGSRYPQIFLNNRATATSDSNGYMIMLTPGFSYFTKPGLGSWLEFNAEPSIPGVSIKGYFSATGTKSRVVATDQYSDRLLYCYETPSPMFGDVGEGVIGEDGRCYVWLDPVFAQTITARQYQVFLQKYGAGDCHVAERRGSCFIVEGTPGLAFGWELKAKQRDFDQKRLERNDEPFTVPAQTYGEDAARHIDELKKERIPA